MVTASSSNQALLPDAAIVPGGAGATRTLTLTPVAEQTGQTTLTVTVSDGTLTATRTALITVGAAAPPQPPTDLSGSALDTTVTLTWVEPATGATPAFYVIEGGIAPGLTTLPVIVTPARATQWTLKLPAGTYFFRVRAANRAGTSGPSNEARVAVTSAVPIVGVPTAFAVTGDGPLVTTRWRPASDGGPLAGWQVELGSAAGASNRGVLALASGATGVSGPLNAGEYFARTRALNFAGPGQPSNEVRFLVGAPPACTAPPPPVVLLPATVTGRIVTLGWRAPASVPLGSYHVLVGSTPGASNLATLDAGAVTALVVAAPPGTYHVTVAAANGCGTSPASNPIVVPVAAIDPPAHPAAAVAGSQVVVSWNPVAGAASYRLEAGNGPGLSNVTAIPVGGTAAVFTGVAPGTYYVRVRAVGAGGELSAPSAEIVVVVP